MLFDISLSRPEVSSCRNKCKRVLCSHCNLLRFIYRLGVTKGSFSRTQSTHNNTAKSIKFTLSTFYYIGVTLNFLKQETCLTKDRLLGEILFLLIPHKFYEALIILLSIIFMYHNKVQKLHIMKPHHIHISSNNIHVSFYQSCDRKFLYPYNPVLLPCSDAK